MAKTRHSPGATRGERVAVVIPARYASTRLPGKPLLVAGGKSILEHVWRNSSRCALAGEVIIATDDQRIESAAKGFGARVEMTGEHSSGTDRIAELVLSGRVDADVIVNVQGDEPEMDPANIDMAVRLLLDDEAADIGTLVTPVTSVAEYENPNAVKAVVTDKSYALYFSRARVPYVRDGIGRGPDLSVQGIYRHLGLYAYRRAALIEFSEAPESRLETLEKLEQLRALEMGLTIKVAVTGNAPAGIDTEEDFRAFVERLESR